MQLVGGKQEGRYASVPVEQGVPVLYADLQHTPERQRDRKVGNGKIINQ